ncbi:MAG: hypothetical protein MUO82_01045, partial [Candidatus Thermoplasmatota archaeon]|nr:hypothetical protein [Candidatus Thermoplasmatota archaeon]
MFKELEDKRKNILKSIIVVFLLCSTTIMMPVANSSEEIKNLNENDYDYESSISNFKERTMSTNIIYWLKFNIFLNKMEQKYGEEWKESFSKFYSISEEYFNSIQLQNPYSISECSKILDSLFTLIQQDSSIKDSPEDFSNSAIESDPFDDYWTIWKSYVEGMDQTLIQLNWPYNFNNYEEWWFWATGEGYGTLYQNMNKDLKAAMFWAALGTAGIPVCAGVAFTMTKAAYSSYIDFLLNRGEAVVWHEALATRSIDIVIYVTDIFGNKIDGLNITATNVEVPESYTSTLYTRHNLD